MWLRDELVVNNNCIYYKEYDFGHLAFLMPADKTILHEIFSLIKRYNPLFSAVKELTEEQKQAEMAVVANVAHMTLAQGAFLEAGNRLSIIDGYLNRI
mmetsp:Transcript_31291/g.41404  ORF Transcript_31291/g.41404 Transcript_31291/m.41404 type:complete len:98 (-) Transcript_31291:40-333(-)